jgi:hypothetical protein
MGEGKQSKRSINAPKNKAPDIGYLKTKIGHPRTEVGLGSSCSSSFFRLTHPRDLPSLTEAKGQSGKYRDSSVLDCHA